MADVSIPREAVDAAARALVPQFDGVHPIDQFLTWEKAVAALNAAAPLIVADALDRFAVKLKQRAAERDAIDEDDPDYAECEHGGDCHTDAAVATWIRAAWHAERDAKQLRAQS